MRPEALKTRYNCNAGSVTEQDAARGNRTLRVSDPAQNKNNAMDATTITELREACAGLARPGGPANFVRMFKPRFAKLVKSGDKTQTIRPLPKRIPRRGDTLSLRVWTGKPYRSKQRVLLETKLDRIEVIRIDEKGIIKPPGEGSILATLGLKLCVLDGVLADRFAQDDGFQDWNEMRDWFKAEHGLPFEGVALYW